NIREYKPRSTLVVPQHPVPRAKFPMIDIHSHQPTPISPEQYEKVVKAMDQLNIRLIVNLSGSSGDNLRRGLAVIKSSPYPDRMVLVANVDFSDVGRGFGQRAARQLEEDIKAGAVGLKIFRTLGLHVHKSDGSRLKVDDRERAPIWQKCGELNVPVLITIAAPLYDFGRQPRAARAFFLKYQDRILFGKDSFQPDEYPYYWRTFETADEYFDYYRDYHAFWKLYGLDLPDEVLKKLYYENALKITPGLPRAAFVNLTGN